jgi:hypothetical protein
MRVKLTGPLLLVESVTLCCALFPFTGVSPRFKLVAEKVSCGGGMAVPVSGITVGLVRALLVIINEPVRVPTAVGLNVTPTIHASSREFRMGGGVWHWGLSAEKSPVAVAFEIVSGREP